MSGLMLREVAELQRRFLRSEQTYADFAWHVGIPTNVLHRLVKLKPETIPQPRFLTRIQQFLAKPKSTVKPRPVPPRSDAQRAYDREAQRRCRAKKAWHESNR